MGAYLYILRCSDDRHYYGITRNLRQRLSQHHRGQVASTRSRRPVELVYFEEHETMRDARLRERSLKNHGMRAGALIQLVEQFPKTKLAPFLEAARPG